MPRLSGTLGDDLNQVSIGIAQQGIPVVVVRVVRRLNYRHPRGYQVSVGGIDVVGPHNKDQGWAAGCRLNTVHSRGCLQDAEAGGESVRPKFDVLEDALNRSPEGLLETKKIALEAQFGLDVADVQIDQRASAEHVCQTLKGPLRPVRLDAAIQIDGIDSETPLTTTGA